MKKVSAVLSVLLLALILSQGLICAAYADGGKGTTPCKCNFGPKFKHPEKHK